MAATARLIVQMTPVEKKALDERAARAGISTTEFVGRRVGRDEFGDGYNDMEVLLSALEAMAPNILASLDEALTVAGVVGTALDKIAQGPAEGADKT